MYKEFDQRHDISYSFNDLKETISLVDFSDSHTTKNNTANNYHLSGVDGLHGWYQTVYDCDLTNSHALPVIDVTFGLSTASILYNPSIVQAQEKSRIYELMMGALLGNKDATLEHVDMRSKATGVDLEGFFVTFKRQKYVSYIDIGSFMMCLDLVQKGMIASYTASDGFTGDPNEPYTSEVYSLKCSAPGEYTGGGGGITPKKGIYLFYNTATIFVPMAIFYGAGIAFSGSDTILDLATGSYIDNLVDGFRTNAIKCLSIDAITRQYHTAYKCRINYTDFNYSSNPTYTNNGRLVMTSGSSLNTMQHMLPEFNKNYITTVGLCDDYNNLLAVGKLSRPVAKDNDSLILTCRIDY